MTLAQLWTNAAKYLLIADIFVKNCLFDDLDGWRGESFTWRQTQHNSTLNQWVYIVSVCKGGPRI